MKENTLFEGLKQLVALIFVNIVPLLLDPAFLQVAITIDALVLGIAVQEYRMKRNEQLLKELILQIVDIKNPQHVKKVV